MTNHNTTRRNAPVIANPGSVAVSFSQEAAEARNEKANEAARSMTNRLNAGDIIDPISPFAPADVRTMAEAKAVRMGTTITLRHDILKRVDTRHGTIRVFEGHATSNGERLQRLAEPRAQVPFYTTIGNALADIAALRAALDETEAALLAHRNEECPGVTLELLDTIAEELRVKMAEAAKRERETAARAEAERQVRAEEAERVAKEAADKEAALQSEMERRTKALLAKMKAEGR